MKRYLKNVTEEDRNIVRDIISFMRDNESILKFEKNKFPLTQLERNLGYHHNKLACAMKRYENIFTYELHYDDWKKWYIKE